MYNVKCKMKYNKNKLLDQIPVILINKPKRYK